MLGVGVDIVDNVASEDRQGSDICAEKPWGSWAVGHADLGGVCQKEGTANTKASNLPASLLIREAC